ncbi:hypothetical protein ACP275_10G087000 [Erythranthe tilingii]
MKNPDSEDSFDAEEDDSYDAVVVGSGYGGSVAACRMSIAGLKVCLLEKGRKWESKDFPTDTLRMISAVRIDNRNLGVSFGPNNALFQVHIEDDSLAATACGLGGGSLVNAGVMLPTPARARRDPRWPKPWEKDWDVYVGSASEMLRVQNIPFEFQNSKIMQQVIDHNEYEKNIHGNPMKLSMSFDIEEHLSESRKSLETSGNCLACGNCLSGCPYNAKNSTDKTYLISAIQAGCIIKTECEVQYVVRNNEEKDFKGRRSTRRWLVFLDEFDYITCDMVILSAGVFGTAKILFQSRLRGLSVSEKLGSGLSCNGNNVAYLDRSAAPLNAFGLNKNQFSNIPFRERPGPSISSSYTSSLGFTIQSAVIPTAYPCFIFKGITTYKWQYRNSLLLLDIIDRLKHFTTGSKHNQSAMVLNAMGYDESNGKLTFEKNTNKITFLPPHDPLLPKKIEAFQKIAKKIGGTLFMSRYRSTSVHLLGGCIVSTDVSSGVCNSEGQVFDRSSSSGVHSGLYICDASLIPCSVGINPCLTIAAAAEHVSKNLVENVTKYVRNFVGNKNYVQKRGFVSKFKTKKRCDKEVTTKEVMRGEIGGMPCAAYLKLRFDSLENSEKFRRNLRGEVGGYILCKGIETDKMYIVHGEVDLCKIDTKTPYTQYMHYHLLISASSGSRYVFEGRKIMNPYLVGLYAWRESTTLDVTLRKITNNIEENAINLKGKLRISFLELLKSAYALEGGSKYKFIFLLMQSLLTTYIMQTPRGSLISFAPTKFAREPYPNSTIHEIQTDEDCVIYCQHWICDYSQTELSQQKKLYPVLLINGYSTESYCLPTEPNDLVRTLLKQGRDVWLLKTRLDPSNNSSDILSIEDIGTTDIPAAMNMIKVFYGESESTKVHVVAHCVGGLAVHISLMGGHISAKHIASLSCTNSSMFFKLTASSSLKMRLPLVQMSMAIMGKNKTLPLLQTSNASFRHRLLKSIARLIPRYERCTCDECEVFSGIFGNTFWHENISESMHYWMNKENLPKLPMSAFPHLRRICNAGFIVDGKGNNSYVIHPERMAVPTLYISGGRAILVRTETSFLANKYMKLHQPGYRHERVVVDGFGHSDLLIGQKSDEKVFPHIQNHIELAEDEMSSFKKQREYNKYKKEALAWSCDPYEDGERFGSSVLPFITILLLVLIFMKLFFSC